MVAAVDGELAPRRRRVLEGHLASCSECRREMASTGAVLERVTGLAMECTVPSHLEQATLRRVRLMAAAEEERTAARGWWVGFRVPALAFATAAVAIVAVGLLRGADDRRLAPSPALSSHRLASQGSTTGKPLVVARGEQPAPKAAEDLPTEPPPELAAAPDLFIELPILRNMEKLEHFEAIRTTTLDDGGEQSNG